MDSKDYFEVNKEKIHATAEFLCSKDLSKNVDEKFEELKQQYFNSDGTKHKEAIKINDSELDISNVWLDMLRHEKIENFMIFAVTEEGSSEIYKARGNQFSSVMDLNAIDKKIVPIIIKGAKNIGLYVVHNHPFIYKASPSYEDLKTLEILITEFNRIEDEAKSIHKYCQITLIDFAIVTEFDYWSFKQSV